ncbi:MAG: hypothetical protein ACW963_00315 [Candidatus Sifarchaeia archaeon]|jgi:hypothetical protein
MNATEENFTKEIFKVLHMEWDQKAKARDVLTQIFSDEEDMESILEDVIFSVNELLDSIRKSRGITVSEGEKKVESFVSIEENKYSLVMGNESEKNIAFTVSNTGGIYIFERSNNSEEKLSIGLSSVNELKEVMIYWLEEFYRQIKEMMG